MEFLSKLFLTSVHSMITIIIEALKVCPKRDLSLTCVHVRMFNVGCCMYGYKWKTYLFLTNLVAFLVLAPNATRLTLKPKALDQV